MHIRSENLCALNRRDFLRVGTAAFAGIDLPRLFASGTAKSDVSCIVLFQNGGACQLDSFDPKPDAPAEIRGSFGTIPTALPGIHISELLPRCARAMNKFSVIRSMHSDEAIHEKARQYIFSGTKPRNDMAHPSFGAVISKELEARNGLPAFVTIPAKDVSAEAGFLGPSFDPFVTGNPNDKNFAVKDLTLPLGLTLEEAGLRKSMLARLDSRFKQIEESPVIDSMDEFYQKAFDLISSPAAKKAFDIGQEKDKLREAYGRTTIGQGALLARRLVESGVRLAAVFHGGYDTHTNHEKGHKPLLVEFDQAFTVLLEDLEQRGLLEKTLVLVIGDFGRTPRINSSAGRDHWPRAFSVALAGAGIRAGVVVGKTDAQASEPAERPVSIEDLGATVYKALGIDASKSYFVNNRPVAINKDGAPIHELLG